jgi:hypothetical protein
VIGDGMRRFMRTIEYGLVILEDRSGVGRDRFGDQDGGEEENKRRLPVQTILAIAGMVYCPPVHPHDLCMYIRYIYSLTIDCQHETGFTWRHTDNPAITPSETRVQSPSTPALPLALSLAKFQQLNILYFFMDIYVCAARRSSIL